MISSNVSPEIIFDNSNVFTIFFSSVRVLLFLKKLYDLSDETLISSAQTDMTYKFFLDLEPEAKMIDPSLLTKFRKTRITEDILEGMLKETIQQALDKGLIKSGTLCELI